jgi:uncharacterized protein (TIGR00251 family)
MAGFEELISETEGGIGLFVHVQPGAGKTRVLGRHGDALKISVAAPPIGGRANEAVVEFLAKTLGVDKAAVKIVHGQTARKKRIEIGGAERIQAAKLLEAALGRARVRRR